MRFRVRTRGCGVAYSLFLVAMAIILMVICLCIPAGLMFLVYEFFLVPTFSFIHIPFWVFLVGWILLAILTNRLVID